MPLAISIFFGFAPMFVFAGVIYWLDRYEKEPLRLLGATFIWGAVIAAGAAYVINTLLGMGVYIFTQSEIATDLSTGSLIAPLVEESLKGLAVLIIFLLFRSEFDSVIDGIVYASIAALGFAATENVIYIYRDGFLENGYQGLFWMVFMRVVVVGWQHPFYTAFTGIGLAAARLNKNPLVKIGAPIAGWSAAVFTHSLHNLLASIPGELVCVFGSALDWGGWLLMLGFILWMLRQEGQLVRKYLRPEVDSGLITSRQYATACSAASQSAARLGALLAGRYAPTNRFYQLCGELAHKNRQLAQFGEERGNHGRVERLRSELAGLAAQVYTPR